MSEPKVAWRHRASPGKLWLARTITAVLLTVVGFVIEVVVASLLLQRDLGGAALALFALYLAVGVLVLIRLRSSEPKPNDEQQERAWSGDVVGRIVRGADRRRPLVLQIVVWLTIGHFMTTALAIYGLFEAIGSFGF